MVKLHVNLELRTERQRCWFLALTCALGFVTIATAVSGWTGMFFASSVELFAALILAGAKIAADWTMRGEKR